MIQVNSLYLWDYLGRLMTTWAKGSHFGTKNLEWKGLSYLHFTENRPSQPRQHYTSMSSAITKGGTLQSVNEWAFWVSVVIVTISFSYAYHNRTNPTFSLQTLDLTMTSLWHHPPMTSFLLHYDLISLHLTPLRRHHQNTINTHRYRSSNLTCSYLVTW